jgi:hypothetical protein
VVSGGIWPTRQEEQGRATTGATWIEGRHQGSWRTPLHIATDWHGYFPNAPAAAGLLVDAGADPNAGTGGSQPETSLHWAASSDVDVAVVLVDVGARLDTPGGSIGTPLDNAIGYGFWHGS